MEIQILTGLEFSRIFVNNCIVYSTSVFNELNRFKVDEVYYLTFRDNKYRLGIILGITGDVAYAPFSAPFGGFLSITGDISVNYITSALNCLRVWLISNKVKSIQITLPPNFYNESFISKQINRFFVHGFVLRSVEINHFFKLSIFL
jgi:hypothetical protein